MPRCLHQYFTIDHLVKDSWRFASRVRVCHYLERSFGWSPRPLSSVAHIRCFASMKKKSLAPRWPWTPRKTSLKKKSSLAIWNHRRIKNLLWIVFCNKISIEEIAQRSSARERFASHKAKPTNLELQISGIETRSARKYSRQIDDRVQLSIVLSSSSSDYLWGQLVLYRILLPFWVVIGLTQAWLLRSSGWTISSHEVKSERKLLSSNLR